MLVMLLTLLLILLLISKLFISLFNLLIDEDGLGEIFSLGFLADFTVS